MLLAEASYLCSKANPPMSSFRKNLPLAAALAAVLGFFLWQFWATRGKFDWDDTNLKHGYSEASEQPYGTRVFRRLLGNYFPGKSVVELKKALAKSLPGDSVRGANYVFVGEALRLDSLDVQRLMAFVAEGNTALISSKTLPSGLADTLYDWDCGGQAWGDYAWRFDTAPVRLSLLSPPVSDTFFYALKNQPTSYRWHYLAPSAICGENGWSVLGHAGADSLVNFVEVHFGRGRFLLHTTPLAFTNFQLLRPPGRAYSEGVLARLAPGEIYWDAFSRTTEWQGREHNAPGDRDFPEQHALTHFLKQPALAAAWYLLLALAVLFVVFRGKRRQRVIPVLPKKENASLEFLGAIADLMFRKRGGKA